MRERLSLTAVRARLAQVEGKEYWRSLEELAETEAFAALSNSQLRTLGVSPGVKASEGWDGFDPGFVFQVPRA